MESNHFEKWISGGWNTVSLHFRQNGTFFTFSVLIVSFHVIFSFISTGTSTLALPEPFRFVFSTIHSRASSGSFKIAQIIKSMWELKEPIINQQQIHQRQLQENFRFIPLYFDRNSLTLMLTAFFVRQFSISSTCCWQQPSPTPIWMSPNIKTLRSWAHFLKFYLSQTIWLIHVCWGIRMNTRDNTTCEFKRRWLRSGWFTLQLRTYEEGFQQTRFKPLFSLHHFSKYTSSYTMTNWNTKL